MGVLESLLAETKEADMAVTPATAQLPRLLRNQWHLFFDPNEEPRLRIPSGGRAVVETEDAHIGSIRTEKDVYKSLAEVFEKLGGANPVTGPIYVEGVEPGDCVAMTIEDIVPGAVQGQGYTVLTPGLGGLVSNYTLQPALEPRTVIAKIRDGKVKFPTAKGVVEIPTSPFLGTIGLAPAKERKLSFVQGPDFLGNVDLPLNGIGATIVMRANVPGALVSFGDAHAVQGDGEISGAAIECQADVTVTLERVPKAGAQYVALPQVNTPDFIGSIAAFTGVHIADCIRAAYVDVINRMVQFHGFTMPEAYLLACQTARVRIGQVVDPLYCAAVTIERRYIS
jgi:acetamidase/formamidase